MMTKEQYEQLVEQARAVGIMLSPPEISEERKQEVVWILEQNPPIDYLRLMR